MRTTDTERGARMAYNLACEALSALPLFLGLIVTGELADIWMGIQFAAVDQMEESRISREAAHGG